MSRPGAEGAQALPDVFDLHGKANVRSCYQNLKATSGLQGVAVWEILSAHDTPRRHDEWSTSAGSALAGCTPPRPAGRRGVRFTRSRRRGVYCRPSCPSRAAKRENVEFFETNEQAAQAGYRACKRCRPEALSQEQRRRALVVQACRTIEQSDSALPLAALARQAGLSPHHFHRIFKAATGLTPKAFLQIRAGEACGERAAVRAFGDGCDLRVGLQFGGTLLRGIGRPARHGAWHLPQGRGRRADPLRRGALRAGAGHRCRHAPRRLRHRVRRCSAGAGGKSA
ncbi:MAG: AraC family transcriptional regulator [Rhodocyclaceae bacterium]|nr:AraC family transcriptional regulator [Rhodocyclaceae bacterium]